METEARNKKAALIDLIDKHIKASPVIIDYQYELDKLKEKWRSYEQQQTQ